MPRTIDEMNRAIMRVRDMPFGSARNEVAAALVREATSEGPQEARAFALFALTESYAFSEDVEKAYLPFTQSVRLWDEHPELFDAHDVHSLFWSFKWMVGNLMEFPSIPAGQITATLDDMERRYRLAGNGLSAVNHLRFEWHHMLGDDTVAQAYETWVTTDRDDFSQCPACEPGDRTTYLFEVGRLDEGIRLLESAQEAKAECHSEPADRLSQLQLAYLDVGDPSGAVQAHRRSLQTLGTAGELAGACGRHVQFLARTGNTDLALRFLDEHHDLLRSAETPAGRLAFLCAAGAGTALLRSLDPTLPVALGDVPAQTVAELDDWMYHEALALAALFDARGGTTAMTDRALRAWSGRLTVTPVDLSVLGGLTAPVAEDAGTLGRGGVDDVATGPGQTASVSSGAVPSDAAPSAIGPDALLDQAEAVAATGQHVAAARLYAEASAAFAALDELEPAGFALAEAAALSSTLHDVEGAQVAFGSALALLERAGTTIAYVGPIVRSYARVCSQRGDEPLAVRVLSEAVRASEEEHRAAAEVEAVPLTATGDGTADQDVAESQAAAAARAVRVTAAERAQLLDTRARVYASAGSTVEAVADAKVAAEAFAELGLVPDAAHAFWLAGRLQRSAGNDADALWLLESASEGFEIARDRTSRSEVSGELIEVLTALGRTAEAEALVQMLAR